MDYQPEAPTRERSRHAPPSIQRRRHPTTVDRSQGSPRSASDDASRLAAPPNTVILAVEHLAIARQMTTFLWILSAALMYQSAALGVNGQGYSVAGLIVMASAILLGYVSHRRLHGTITNCYVRDGLSEAEARKLASRDVERAHSGLGDRDSNVDVKTIGARLDGRDP